MTETVKAPEAEATEAEATESGEGQTAEAAAPKPVTVKEKITKAMSKDMPALHLEFIQWMKDEADIDLDQSSVLATQSLYNVFRKTERYAKVKAEQPTGGPAKEQPLPKTPEEAKAALEKHQKDAERRRQQQERADARAAKIQELLAGMAGEESGEEATDVADSAETDEELAEAF
jgi:hypothetical protein